MTTQHHCQLGSRPSGSVQAGHRLLMAVRGHSSPGPWPGPVSGERYRLRWAGIGAWTGLTAAVLIRRRKGLRQMSKTTDVRAAVEAELGFDPRVDSSNITVVNIGGDINLTGTVPSYPQYLEAAAGARRVVGVKTVDNNLEVALPESDWRDDVKLATAANNALAGNVTVPDSGEAIANDGNITLTGTVSYGTERAAAEAAVTSLTGVRNVTDDIDIGYVIDPVDVDLHVQQALERSAAVPDGSDVTANTKDGIITLTGHVRTWAEHDAVVVAAQMAQGVIDVRDNLEVTGGPPRAGQPPSGRKASVVLANNSPPHRWRPARCCLTAPRNKVPRPGRGYRDRCGSVCGGCREGRARVCAGADQFCGPRRGGSR